MVAYSCTCFSAYLLFTEPCLLKRAEQFYIFLLTAEDLLLPQHARECRSSNGPLLLPAQDLLHVTTDAGEVLVPFVKAIVPAVDIAAGTLTVTPPTGLFEELPDDDDDESSEPPVASDEAAHEA